MAGRRLVVEIVGDASSLERAFSRSAASSRTWRNSLSASTGATVGLSRASKAAEADVGKFSRGILAGSGAARGLGRSLAFASGRFLAFAAAAEATRAAVESAEQLQKATDSLAVVIRRANGDVGRAIPLLDRWAKAQQRLGVSETEALVGLRTTAVLTGSVQKGMLAYTMGLELARAENISLNSAMRISAKALLGQTTSLTRYGIILPKTTDAQKIFNAFQVRFAKQAETNTSAFDRLRAAASNLGVSIGRVLIPIFEKYAADIERWLSQAQNQRRVIDAVTTTVSVLAETFGALFRAGRVVFSGLEKLRNLFGSWKPVIIGVTAALVALGVVNPWLALAAGAVFVISHWKQVETFFSNLEREIVNAFKYVWYQLERGALKAALAVVEPFSHLPSFLGGWARKAKDSMQAQLDRLHPPNMNWGGVASRAGTATGEAWAQAFIAQARRAIENLKPGTVIPAHRAGPRGEPEGTFVAPKRRPPFGTDTGAGGGTGGGGGTAAFTLPFRLQLEQAQAAVTKTLRDDIEVARRIRAFILRAIPHLYGQKLIDAYQALAQINQEIASDVQQAAGAARKAAQKAQTFTEPLRLQLALARDAALGLDQTSDLEKLRRLILKFIRTHRHNIQALIDAYNQLAQVNEQLGQTAGTALNLFKQASTKALTANLNLTAEQRKILRARLSQLGVGGTVPGQGVAAEGFAIDPATGRPVVLDRQSRMRRLVMSGAGGGFTDTLKVDVYIHPKNLAQAVTVHQQIHRRHNPRQRRGPNTGG